MSQIIKMAWRDLMRNPRRSFFSALALGIGLALLLLMASFVEGEMRQSLESTLRLQSGHLQVRAASYDEDKTSLAWEDLILEPQTLADKITALPPVQVATPRLYASGIAVVGENSLGVRIIGIDPLSAANAPFQEALVGGEFLQPEDREGVLIGQSLADKLGLKTGDSLNLLVNTSNGEVDEQRFIVRGIYNTHVLGFDQMMVFMPLAKAQTITRTEDRASVIFILLKDRLQTEAVVDALRTSQYKVLTFEEMNLLLTQTEEMANAYIYLLYLIVLGITVTVIINTLIMAVFERTREIGILSAIGMRSSRIMAMFFAETSLLAVGGILIGLVLGGLLIAYTSKYGFYIGDLGVTGILFAERIYTILTVEDTVSLTILAFIITLLAGIYPAFLASRLEPVDALRGGKQV